MSVPGLKSSGRFRPRAALAVPLAVIALVVAACVPETPPATTTSTSTTSTTTTSTTTTSTTTIPEPTGPTIVGEACAAGEGVTVVVDFTALDDTVKIGCAPGEQAHGFAALGAAGFVIGSEAGPGTVCTVNGVPEQGFPFCWSTGGFWSYWKSPGADTPWDFAMVGSGDGPLPVGSIEGWSWAHEFNSAAPRVSVAALADHTPVPVCAVPDAPVLSIIDDDEVLPFTIDDGGPIEIAVIAADAGVDTAEFAVADSVDLGEFTNSEIRVLARSASPDCETVAVFDAVYDVREDYSGRPETDPRSVAIAASSESIVGWATGHSAYNPGTDVTENWQVPSNAYGAATGNPTVLGNGGSITMTFDEPITDGDGYDLAVYENGFYQNNANDMLFAEFAWVEVSSNGSDFVRFDSASRWQTSIGAFGFLDTRHVGGLAGTYNAGFGTPFDLSTLTNKPPVRSGLVDLSAITHVRVVDVVGGSPWPDPDDVHVDLDSFGRTIVDNFRTVGAGGFDLTGIAVLNRATA